MIKISRILKHYTDTGAVNELLNLYGFLDEQVFLTKSGSVGVVLRVSGIDDECLDVTEREQVVQRFAGALRLFDEQFRLYQYLLKRRVRGIPAATHSNTIVNEVVQRRAAFLGSRSLYTLDIYFVVLLEPRRPREQWARRVARYGAHPIASLGRALCAGAAAIALADDLRAAVARLRAQVASFCLQLADSVNPSIANKHEAFALFRRLLNYASEKADRVALKHDAFLDYYAADSALECHRGFLRLDDHYIRVLTLKEPPSRTFVGTLRALYGVPAEFIAVTEWQREGQGPMRKSIQSKRRHFHNAKTSLLNYVQIAPPTSEEMLIDEGASAVVADLGACLRDLELHGHYFGSFSLTLVLFDTDAERLDSGVAECVKVFTTSDAVLTDERYNLLNAWLAAVPGNSARNLRLMYLLNTNYADLSFLFTAHAGDPRNGHLNRECLAVLETADQTPYYLNLHHADIAHSVVLGATGSGKSFLLNFLVTHLQKYDPYTVIFDLGGSYEHLTARMGGGYLRLGLDHREVTINPFVLPRTREQVHFLFMFVKVLLESAGQCRLTNDDDRDLYEQIGNLYELDPDQRRLLTLSHMLPRPLTHHLYRWVGSGPYAELFDHVEDTLTCAPFQCFDFEGLDRYPQLLEPLLFYVLHRANANIRDSAPDGRFKVFVIDEAWRFLRNVTIKRYLTEALKTWRKHNAAVVLATQSSDDLAQSEVLRLVADSCATRFFLSNPGCDPLTYRDVFGLNDVEVDCIARLIPRQQLLVKRPDVAKVLNLYTPPEERTHES